jgi:ribosomal-protein-alanine N-acetyltransferase
MALAQDIPGPRVDIRPAHPADAALLKRWREEASVRRYQPLGEVSASQLRADMAGQHVSDLRRGRGQKFQWIVLVDGEPAGWITLVVANWEHGLAELGYALSTPFQRRGVMATALGQLLSEVFVNAALERVEARCAIDNVASQRVLEKLGFQREGLLRGYFVLAGERVDNYLYALLRQEYLELIRL